jgi:hypothetical protein
VHVTAKTDVYFYPSEDGVEYCEEVEIHGSKKATRRHTYGFGKIYIVRGGAIIAQYSARGGPKEKFKGNDRHIHSSIQPGDYVLSAAIQYTTPNWPNSCIPWGAQIRRASDGEVEYNASIGWQHATGSPEAQMNKAVASLVKRTRGYPPTEAEAEQVNELAKQYFDVDPDQPTGDLVKVWQRNDFGEWAFALLQNGKRTGFFIHTTPDDELDPTHALEPSHGCIHMRPIDRNAAKTKGYLARGLIIHVKAFGAKGPPQ